MTVTTETPAAPKWETIARDQVKAIRSLVKPALDMRDRDANEGDTRLLVTDVLVDVLGYDKYADLSTEYQTRGEFADYGLRIDGQLVAMIEVKRAAQKLTERHLRQVESYGLKEGVNWLILTNAVEWRLYRLDTDGASPVEVTLAYTWNLETLSRADVEAFLDLHKQMVKRGRLEAAWTRISALSAPNLRQRLLSNKVVTAVRLDVKRESGLNATDDEVRAALESMLS